MCFYFDTKKVIQPQSNLWLVDNFQPIKNELVSDWFRNGPIESELAFHCSNLNYVICIRFFCIFRDEIASCIAKAYDRLNLTEAARLLFFDGKAATKDVTKYAIKVYFRFYFVAFIVECYFIFRKASVFQKDWILSGDQSGFVFVSDKDRKADERILDSDRLVANHIFYAKQLEMIVWIGCSFSIDARTIRTICAFFCIRFISFWLV